MSGTCREITRSQAKLSVRKAFDKMNTQIKKIDAPHGERVPTDVRYAAKPLCKTGGVTAVGSTNF